MPLEVIDVQQLGLEFGGGGVIGAIIGFAAKKLAKLLAVIVGLQLAAFKFLESRGVLQVNWDRISENLAGVGSAATGEAPSWVMTILSTLSVSAGFTAGFLVGFKRG